MENMESAYISVIISAFNRKKYLLEALGSVVNQSLSRDKYEIILVKNFSDANIDDYTVSNNIHNIHSKDATLSGKIREGLKIAKGNVICFLDDDDTFYENKLEYVFEKFIKDDNLGYFHNGFSSIDADGKTIAYTNENPDFNMSSISVSRKILVMDTISTISKSIDTLIYLYALDSGMKMELDKTKLTYYRVTSDSVTHSFTNIQSFKEFSYSSLNVILDSYIQMMDIFHSEKILRILYHKISFTRIRLRIFGGSRVGPGEYIRVVLTPTLESRSYEAKVMAASIFLRKYSIDKLYKNEKEKEKHY
jgi:glycosyltransferase involved in cell wall biosynthesis